jgi:hypothetical protein
MISAALVRAYATLLAVNWSRSNFCLDMFRSKRPRNISVASSEFETQSTIAEKEPFRRFDIFDVFNSFNAA